VTLMGAAAAAVEREGVSVWHPCRPVLLATYNPAEGDVRPGVLDRVAILVGADSELTPFERVAGVEAALGWGDGDPALRREFQDATEELVADIAVAQALLPSVRISREQVMYLCEECSRAGVEGNRAEVFASRVARQMQTVASPPGCLEALHRAARG